MNIYRTAMLKAYWCPTLLFYGIPAACLILSELPPVEALAAYSLPVVAPFAVGVCIAPIFGPKVKESRFYAAYAIAMGYVCLVAFFVACVVSFLHPEDRTARIIVGGATITLILGSVPTLLGAMYFTRYCRAINGGS